MINAVSKSENWEMFCLDNNESRSAEMLGDMVEWCEDNLSQTVVTDLMYDFNQSKSYKEQIDLDSLDLHPMDQLKYEERMYHNEHDAFNDKLSMYRNEI